MSLGGPYLRWPTVDLGTVVADFGTVSFDRLTSFFVIEMELVEENARVSAAFVINAELVGAPSDRRERTLVTLLENGRDLIRFLLLLLGEIGADDLAEAIDVWTGDKAPQGDAWLLAQWNALFEPMVRALAVEPARLDEIARLMHELEATEAGVQLLPGRMARGLAADLANSRGAADGVSKVPLLDPGPVMAGLKDFQRRTVDYVFRRMYEDDPPARRFLVADEVGLGKTLVARGLIARAIRHLQIIGTDRIDIVYICSNADIARQNINRLNVTEHQEFNLPTRITLLPLQLHALKSHGINFVSFTPGTTFDLIARRDHARAGADLLVRWYSVGLDEAAPRGSLNVLHGTALSQELP